MKKVNASEFKAKCLAILDQVRDTGETVLILKHGKAVARLVPAPNTEAVHPQMELKGSVRVLGDIISPVLPQDHWEALKEE